jgi:hypothetical protein
MSRRSVNADDLGRPRRTRRENVTILVVSEGESREPQYFRGLARHLKSTGVKICTIKALGTGRGPEKVVERARKETNNGRLVGNRDGFDYVWCVFDVDDHAHLEYAIREALGSGFRVAISNPCFEIWLIWHFEDLARYIDRDKAKKKLRVFGFNDAGMPANFDYAKHRDAMDRARIHLDDRPPNPGSRVWALVENMRRYES